MMLKPDERYPEPLLTFFLYHLSRIYHGKSHLLERLPQLAQHNLFRNLKLAIGELGGDVQRQLARMELMHELLDRPLQTDTAGEVSAMVDYSFRQIRIRETGALSDLSLIYYLQLIESIEMSCFKLMRMAAVKLHNKQVIQLLKENYDEAKANRLLFLMLATECIIS